MPWSQVRFWSYAAGRVVVIFPARASATRFWLCGIGQRHDVTNRVDRSTRVATGLIPFAENQVALPMAGHRTVDGFGRWLGDVEAARLVTSAIGRRVRLVVGSPGRCASTMANSNGNGTETTKGTRPRLVGQPRPVPATAAIGGCCPRRRVAASSSRLYGADEVSRARRAPTALTGHGARNSAIVGQ